jgi:hypothetical protein
VSNDTHCDGDDNDEEDIEEKSELPQGPQSKATIITSDEPTMIMP